MPRSTRTFTHTIRPRNPEDTAAVAAKARKILGWACDGDKRITCLGIEGEALGQVTLIFTIKARDQWWAKQLAQDLINYITWGMSQKVDLDLRSMRLPPHMNRGYGHGRTKRWREAKAQDGDDEGYSDYSSE